MQVTEKLITPGEHSLLFQGIVGTLESTVTIPESMRFNFMAFLGHPHSLQGGTMNNKVVTTLARAFRELGIPSLRFNFRGVGQSEGIYDSGLGESEDMLLLVQEWRKVHPEMKLIFAGFSFGSYVAYRAAAQSESHLLITVAPPVHHFDYQEFDPRPSPWVILQGDEDEVVLPQLVFDFAMIEKPEIPVIRFPKTSHFFHGKLLELKAKLKEYMTEKVVLS